ncbi:MAG: glycosyltransferase family 2 protein, partial [Verrucomicrobiota bacterium]
MKPTVSIVIINYNYEDFLADAIESALAQSEPAEQILVVDDGSTDDSRRVIESFVDQIETCYKENGGQPSAYNAALPLVDSDIVLILDSDDLLDPNCIETIRNVWKPGITKVQFPLTYIDGAGNETGGATPRVHHVGPIRETALRFGGYASPPSSGNAYCRTFLDTIFPLSEESKYSADCLPITLAPCYGEVIGLEASLGKHRVHQSQSSTAPGEGLNHV